MACLRATLVRTAPCQRSRTGPPGKGDVSHRHHEGANPSGASQKQERGPGKGPLSKLPRGNPSQSRRNRRCVSPTHPVCGARHETSTTVSVRSVVGVTLAVTAVKLTPLPDGARYPRNGQPKMSRRVAKEAGSRTPAPRSATACAAVTPLPVGWATLPSRPGQTDPLPSWATTVARAEAPMPKPNP